MICTSFQEMDESLATWRSGLQTGQGMKDSAVCHAVVAFPDVMAGDNDENSILRASGQSARLEAGSFFFIVVSKEHKAVLGHVSQKTTFQRDHDN